MMILLLFLTYVSRNVGLVLVAYLVVFSLHIVFFKVGIKVVMTAVFFQLRDRWRAGINVFVFRNKSCDGCPPYSSLLPVYTSLQDRFRCGNVMFRKHPSFFGIAVVVIPLLSPTCVLYGM